MEFSETAKANALKFLEEVASKERPSLAPHYPQLCLAEVEAECLDQAKNYLAKLSCPGILSYYISCEAFKRLSTSLDKYLLPSEEESRPMYNSDGVLSDLLIELHSVCEEWAASLPLMTAPVDKVDLSIFAIKNTRRKMEDRHALCVDVNALFGLKDYPHQAYYSIFDGHIGVEAASYAAITLLTNLVRHELFKDDPEGALKGAIKVTDDNVCSKNLPRSGTTAVACLQRGNKVYTGWVGDSQAMIVRNSVPTQLVKPHKPDQDDEQQRIETAGGVVLWNGAWRVNGNLSVSRAIGDAPDKKFVIGVGDVSVADIEGTEDYLMLACDGIWDVLSMEEIVTCVQAHLTSPGGSKQTVAKAIIQLAKSEGSGDNMTVIVSFFSTFIPPIQDPPPASTDASVDTQLSEEKPSAEKVDTSGQEGETPSN